MLLSAFLVGVTAAAVFFSALLLSILAPSAPYSSSKPALAIWGAKKEAAEAAADAVDDRKCRREEDSDQAALGVDKSEMIKIEAA